MSKMNKVARVVQIMWLAIAAVCVVEAGLIYSSDDPEKESWILFAGVALFAIFRYITLRRQQLKKQDKM